MAKNREPVSQSASEPACFRTGVRVTGALTHCEGVI
jgi:hypothetical protein